MATRDRRMLLAIGLLIVVAVWLPRPRTAPPLGPDPRDEPRPPAVRRTASGSPACVRVRTAAGEGLAGVGLESSEGEAVTGTDGESCFVGPVMVRAPDWPTVPAELELVPGETRELLAAARCTLDLEVAREDLLRVKQPEALVLRREPWSVRVAADAPATVQVPCGTLEVSTADPAVYVVPSTITTPRAHLRLGLRPTLAVRVTDGRGAPVGSATVGGEPTDPTGRAVLPAYGGVCVQVEAEGYVTEEVCPTPDGWPAGEQDVVLAPARRVEVFCEGDDGGIGPCPRPHPAVCVAGDIESTCSSRDPFVCACPEGDATVLAGNRLIGWSGRVERASAILRPGSATVLLTGEAVGSLGADACAGAFLLDPVGRHASHLIPGKPTCDAGRVVWLGLSPGRWMLSANEGPLAGYGPFELVAGTTHEIRLEEPAGPTRAIRLRARLPTGEAVPGADVRVRYPLLATASERTDETGEATLLVAHGAVEILAIDRDGRACRVPVPDAEAVDCVLTWQQGWLPGGF